MADSDPADTSTGTPTTTVVVALPAAGDPVQDIGAEQKHATLVFLGDLTPEQADVVRQAVASYVAGGVEDGTLDPFPEHVTGVESLGEDGARVWMIASDDGLAVIHDHLAALPAIADLMAGTEQFPTYRPHVTIGYPAAGGEGTGTATAAEDVTTDRGQLDDPTETAAAEVTSISFDRLAVWSGEDQTEYPLTNGGAAVGESNDPKAVHETAALTERASSAVDGRWPVQIIDAGRGSSGYYSPEVLERAATKRLIESGTPLFFDHPSKSARVDRPERSVRDIAAVFTSEATYDPAGKALIGEVQVFGPYRELVAEMAPYIGLSIDGSATDIVEGTVDGVRMPVVEDLHAINSVDLVTKAGRGGKFLSLYESARAEVDRQAEQAGAGVDEATNNEKQCALNDAVKSAYGADKTYAWVRDFDDTTVWFEISTSDSEDLYGQTYTYDASTGEASLTGSRTEVRAVTSYVPAARPDDTTTTESHKEMHMGTKQIEESEFDRLTEQAGRVTTLEAALSKTQGELTEAKAALLPNKDLRERITSLVTENAMLRAREVAAPMIAEALDDALIGEAAKRRIAGELIDSITLKETDEGQKVLDQAQLTEAINTKVRVAEAEAQELREAMGMGTGQVRGLGSGGGGLLVEQKLEQFSTTTADALSKAFGLSEASAKTAAQGR